MKEKDPDDADFEVNYIHYARDLNGKLVHVGVVRRNRRRVPRFDPSIMEPELTDPEESAKQVEMGLQASFPWIDDSRYYVNLNDVERRTWGLVLSALSVSEIARRERVSHQAILSRIRGDSKGEGGMISKNFWVLLWWRLRQKYYAPKRLSRGS